MRAKPSADGPDRDWDAADVEALAVRLLGRREHSRAELARKLASRGVPPELSSEVLDDLRARRLQSDARYAESLVTSRAGRGQGPVRILRELAQQGVDASVAEEALAASGEDFFSLAARVRHRRFGPGAPSEWKERARQMRFLEYRGFTGDQIRAAVGDDEPA
ncbi:MAG: regulatory protein RecX [Gammaproteobacteria bacterium]